MRSAFFLNEKLQALRDEELHLVIKDGLLGISPAEEARLAQLWPEQEALFPAVADVLGWNWAELSAPGRLRYATCNQTEIMLRALADLVAKRANSYHFTLDEPDYSGEVPESIHTYLGAITAVVGSEAYHFLERRHYYGREVVPGTPAPGQAGFRTNLLSFADEFTGLPDVVPAAGLLDFKLVKQEGGSADV